MHLIATRDFRDPKGRIRLQNQQHKNHIHKGARFTLGGDVTDLKKIPDERDQKFLAALFLAKCIEPDTAESIARIESELAMEAKREAWAKEQDAKAGLAAIGLQVVALGEAKLRATNTL